jgi:hypothetical protein
VTGNHVALAGHNGANLTSTISGLAMFGTVTANAGQNLPFSAALSPRPAGVFRADVQINKLATVIGWAVLPDGTEVGLAVAGATRYLARHDATMGSSGTWRYGLPRADRRVGDLLPMAVHQDGMALLTLRGSSADHERGARCSR